MNRASVSLVRCGAYTSPELETAVDRAVRHLGGIEKFITANDRVLIKPNLLSARKPEEGVNTHPEFLRAVARLAKTVTPTIVVGDSPGGWELKEIDRVYETTGVKRICEEEGLRLVKFDAAVQREGFPIAAVCNEVDAIISLPKLKSHSTTLLTGAVKNMFGMVVGLAKAQCHLRSPMPAKFAPVLAKVYGLVKPVLSIMDGVVGMEGEGPAAGTLRNFGLILASADAVALDAVLARLIGIDPLKILTTAEAAKAGHGIADLSRIDIYGEQPGDVAIRNFKWPKTSYLYNIPSPLISMGLKAVRFFPYIRQKLCQRCELCFKICPKHAIIKKADGSFWVVRHECIHCYCCYEVCPHKAIVLKKSLLAKMLMR